MFSSPELPDITVYVKRLGELAGGTKLRELQIVNPFFLRTGVPDPKELAGRTLQETSRLGKQVVMDFGQEWFAVLHLMVAGRLRWQKDVEAGQGRGRPGTLAAFHFDSGTLWVTEAGTKRRASLHLVRGREALGAFDRGGVSVFDDSPEAFLVAMRRRNRTLKRALTDPSILDGIGNSYSDEILHKAKMSPFQETGKMSDEELLSLRSACADTLSQWTQRLLGEARDGLSGNVTAFHKQMAVHGKYKKPCPVCGTPIQRIVYAENESNYCPLCQTKGRVLADRGLSRLLRDDWPRTIEDLEKIQRPR